MLDFQRKIGLEAIAIVHDSTVEHLQALQASNQFALIAAFQVDNESYVEFTNGAGLTNSVPFSTAEQLEQILNYDRRYLSFDPKYLSEISTPYVLMEDTLYNYSYNLAFDSVQRHHILLWKDNDCIALQT